MQPIFDRLVFSAFFGLGLLFGLVLTALFGKPPKKYTVLIGSAATLILILVSFAVSTTYANWMITQTSYMGLVEYRVGMLQAGLLGSILGGNLGWFGALNFLRATQTKTQ